MAGLDHVPAVATIISEDAAARISGKTAVSSTSAHRTLLGGFGGVAPIKAHGDRIPADLYGLHAEEILRQPVQRADFGLKTPLELFGLKNPPDLAGLPVDIIRQLGAKRPRGE